MTDFSDFSPEQQAHVASGIGTAAFAWIAAVREGDVARIWHGLDDNLRLVLVQQWLYDNPAAADDPTVENMDEDELAVELAGENPTHPLWTHCGRVSMRAVRSGTAGFEDVELGQAPRTRVVGTDLELVQLIPLEQLPLDERGFRIHPQGVTVRALALVMRLVAGGGWKVAGIGPRLPVPDWPPYWEELPAELTQ